MWRVPWTQSSCDSFPILTVSVAVFFASDFQPGRISIIGRWVIGHRPEGVVCFISLHCLAVFWNNCFIYPVLWFFNAHWKFIQVSFEPAPLWLFILACSQHCSETLLSEPLMTLRMLPMQMWRPAEAVFMLASMECAWNCVSRDLKEVGPELVAPRTLMLHCLGPQGTNMGHSVVLLNTLPWETGHEPKKAHTSKAWDLQAAPTPIFLYNVFHLFVFPNANSAMVIILLKVILRTKQKHLRWKWAEEGIAVNIGATTKPSCHWELF